MGTLITLRRSVGAVYAEAAAELGIDVDAGHIDRLFPTVHRQAPPLAFPAVSDAALTGLEQAWWAACIDELFLQLGNPLDQCQLTQISQQLMGRFAEPGLWRCFEEVPTLLRRWRGAGLKLAVVSNFDSRLDALLAGLGLHDCFDAVLISSRVGAAKPDPRLFEAALAALQLSPQQVWHLGDAREDLEGARAAGIPCLLVER
ncbi:MAG: HAD family hydrolase [Aphanocapsa feldmannii 288cV]|nr:MAG: HAD family hydrolase [Aphanocapsa feldmannii 288cV]